MITTRLDSFLAQNGLCARRKAADFLKENKVLINNKLVTESGLRFTHQQLATLTVNDKPCKAGGRLYYFMLNKPEGYLSASSDDRGRPLAVNLIKENKDIRLYNVGRLDYNSCGLLLFTNDGAWTKTLSHPSSGIEKEYYVEVTKPLDKFILDKFKAGITAHGEHYRIKNYHKVTGQSVNLILTEGKKRSVVRGISPSIRIMSMFNIYFR